jgi:hypothetical protein
VCLFLIFYVAEDIKKWFAPLGSLENIKKEIENYWGKDFQIKTECKTTFSHLSPCTPYPPTETKKMY